MPNHVENHIEFNGDKQQIDAMLNKIGSDEYGTGTIDFKKIISMPETLNIEAGSRTDHGLKAYREFIEVYTAGRSDKEALKALENIPTESENAFLCQRTDMRISNTLKTLKNDLFLLDFDGVLSIMLLEKSERRWHCGNPKTDIPDIKTRHKKIACSCLLPSVIFFGRSAQLIHTAN